MKGLNDTQKKLKENNEKLTSMIREMETKQVKRKKEQSKRDDLVHVNLTFLLLSFPSLSVKLILVLIL